MPRDATDDALAAMREAVRRDAQDRPGVYRMLADDGEVLYVGKSKQLRTRLLSYFRCVFPEEKGARLIRAASRVEWDYVPSEFAALLQELKLIKRFRPRYNVAMTRDARHYAFIRVTRGVAPRLQVVRGTAVDQSGFYYGPFHGAQSVEDALRELNDLLGLRDCTLDGRMTFNDQSELFQIQDRTPACIRYEIRRCLGPCIGACSAKEYEQRVTLARAFFDGTTDGPLETLRADMDQASERLEYERAATLRDKLIRLEGLREQFGQLRFAVETLSFVYTVPGHEGEDRVYLIRRGTVRGEAPAPRTAKDRRRLRELVASVFEPDESATGAIPRHEIDELFLLTSWFRRFPDQLGCTNEREDFRARRAS